MGCADDADGQQIIQSSFDECGELVDAGVLQDTCAVAAPGMYLRTYMSTKSVVSSPCLAQH